MDEAASRPAVFLDRDGVLNHNRHDYVKSWTEFEFLPGALEALRRLGCLGWPVVVVSNQSAVGRGLVSLAEVEAINARMVAEVQQAGGRLDRVLYCPHHPREACDCRKPRPGLLLQAAEELGLDLARSFMVGDAASDIHAALAAGCRPVLVKTGRGAAQLKELTAHHDKCHLAHDLEAAVDWIAGQVNCDRMLHDGL